MCTIWSLLKDLDTQKLPDMPETISGAEILRKGTPHSFAIAFAKAVFPHPGGP